MAVIFLIAIIAIYKYLEMTRYAGTIMNKLEENYLLSDFNSRDVRLN